MDYRSLIGGANGQDDRQRFVAPFVPRFGERLWSDPSTIVRDGAGGLSFSIIPAPSYPAPVNTLRDRKEAIAASYGGSLMRAVDLYRQTVGEDGFYRGILAATASIIALPISFTQGTPEMQSALQNADGTAGDWARMHPQTECGQIFEDMIAGFPGLGQYLLMCWRCGYTEHDQCKRSDDEAPDAPYLGGQTFEVCRRCHARRHERPIGQRELYRLHWRDPRWMDQNTFTRQWHYTGRQGRIPITPGDGQWVMLFSGPSLESWRTGHWVWATLGAIFSRDTKYDAQNTSAVCAPTPTFKFTKPSSPQAREEARQRARDLGFDNRLILPFEVDYKIESASADYIDVTSKIVERCSGEFEQGITGVVMGRAASAAFTDAPSVFARTTADRRRVYSGAWYEQLREQGLVHWGVDNYGSRNVPVAECDVRSPADKLAASTALMTEGNALTTLKAGMDGMGIEADPGWLVERLARAGIRARVKTTAQVPSVIAPSSPPSTGPSSPQLPAGSAPEDEEPQEPDDAARLAEKMTAHGLARCEHGGVNRCRLCGIERVRDFDVGEDGAPRWRVMWRAIAQRRASALEGGDRGLQRPSAGSVDGRVSVGGERARIVGQRELARPRRDEALLVAREREADLGELLDELSRKALDGAGFETDGGGFHADEDTSDARQSQRHGEDE